MARQTNRIVVSFKSTHQIEAGNTLIGISWNTLFNIAKSTSLDELICSLINFGILMINLHFMESIIAHATRMNHKSTLCNTACVILLIFFIKFIIILNMRELRSRLANYFHWLELTIFTNRYEPPIIKSTLPELAKIDLNLLHDIILFNYIPLFDFVPC